MLTVYRSFVAFMHLGLLGDIADKKRFRLLRHTLLFRGPFVCLSRSSCIVLKRQKISTQFLLHTTAPCVSQIGQFLPTQIVPPNDPLPC